MRAALYLRVSTAGQVDKSIPAQEDECRAFAESNGWHVARTFKDEGISAFKDVDRPGFNAMRAAAEAGEFDVLVVWNTDRLTGERTGFRTSWLSNRFTNLAVPNPGCGLTKGATMHNNLKTALVVLALTVPILAGAGQAAPDLSAHATRWYQCPEIVDIGNRDNNNPGTCYWAQWVGGWYAPILVADYVR